MPAGQADIPLRKVKRLLELSIRDKLVKMLPFTDSKYQEASMHHFPMQKYSSSDAVLIQRLYCFTRSVIPREREQKMRNYVMHILYI